MPVECKNKLNIDNYYAKIINPLKQPSSFNIGTFIIKPFNLPHTNNDWTLCVNLGYLIYSTVTKERLLFCTDCHYINYNFPPCEYYFIECNYSKINDFLKELEFINKTVEMRRMNSHMSLQTFIKFMSNQDLTKCKEIHPIHISNSNLNNPETFKKEIEKIFLKKVIL